MTYKTLMASTHPPCSRSRSRCLFPCFPLPLRLLTSPFHPLLVSLIQLPPHLQPLPQWRRSSCTTMARWYGSYADVCDNCVRTPPTGSPVEGAAEEDATQKATPVADEGAVEKTPAVNGPRVARRVRKPNVRVCGPEWLRQ
jgi:hypothetical protein